MAKAILSFRNLIGSLMALSCGASALGADAAGGGIKPHAGMLQYPDISASRITFVYANDIWTAPRDGGAATPLASPPGPELFPKFSPNGEDIAFVGNYDGNRDVYVISTTGGTSQRLTYHPSAETLCDWTPDGKKLLFYMNGLAGLARQSQLFTVSVEGGLPDQIPLPYATVGAISQDGTWLAYTPHTTDFRTWKRYRGGMATDIWLFNLKDYTSKRMTDWEGTDTLPMWHKDVVYYLSDQGDNHKLNIWSYSTKSGQREQVTTLDEYDVKWPSIGPGDKGQGEIIFQHGPALKVVDLGSKKIRTVEITVPGDRPTLREKEINYADFISAMDVSPSGKRIVVESRGDIWDLPAEKGMTRNITRTSGVAERDPIFSPDGKWIAYLSDATGEYEMYLAAADGTGEPKQLTSDGSAYRYMRSFSPDSKKIVFTDKSGAIYLYTIEGSHTKKIATEPWAGQVPVSWSHDSAWLTYNLGNDNQMSSVWLYNVKKGEATQVTADFFDATWPAFDRKGEYLYFVGKRRFSPDYSDIDTTFIYDKSDVVLVVPLNKDVKDPFAPKNDAEEKKDDKDKKDGKKGEKKDAAKDSNPLIGVWDGEYSGADPKDKDKKTAFTFTFKKGEGDKSDTIEGVARAGGSETPITNLKFDKEKSTFTLTIADATTYTIEGKVEGDKLTGTWKSSDERSGDFEARKNAEESKEPVKIDIEGFERRAIPLPLKPGQFSNLWVSDSGKLLFVRRGGAPSGDDGDPGAGSIRLFDVTDDKKEEKTVFDGVGGFVPSADGKKILVRKGNDFGVLDAAPDQKMEKKAPLDAMKGWVSPRDEWKQIFNEAWRLQRDFFYVSNMHGVDWPAIRDQYACMLADCVTRDDLSYVIKEMISELNIGHAYYSGGDVEKQPSTNVGLLGCDFEVKDGAFRIKSIQEGAAWDSDARGPLSQPGTDVKVGDYLLAVNGVPMDVKKSPWAAFLGTTGQVVQLTVSENPTKDDKAREVLVKPIGSEIGLRYRAWVEHNRKYVEEKSGGTIGYIYVPNTGVEGQNELYRQFYGQKDKKGLIIDERWNGGGQIPTRFIELLNRPRVNYWARRDGHDWPWPQDSMNGPKAMLINGLAGSGGDMFPALFRQMGVGKIIGMRTWGGLVGISGNPGLIDGGSITVPTFGYYKMDGTWGIEGHGVDPDMEVIDDPSKLAAGGDPQLDAAIDYIKNEIQRNPFKAPNRPASPDRKGMGIRAEDK
ncbi:MAG TPA: PDZ domain-containing protein [Phycisphaerales bacterium]|nr:PDZ domain-containing protein [Phycisphaerales bacterium]